MDSGIHKVYRLDNQPFAQIPRQAIRNPRITPNAFRLLAYLMSHAHGYDLTYGQIERETGMGRFAINGAIGNLTELGWLKTDRPKLPNGQFGAKAWYVLDPDGVSSVGNSTVGDSTVEQPTDIENKNLENKTTKNNYPQAELEDAFEKFWQLYPRKVEKLAAKRMFAKQYPEFGDVIIAGVQRLAADPNLPPKQYIPYPASWLNSGGWDSEPYPERVLTKEERAAKEAAEYAARRAAEEQRRKEQRIRDEQERQRRERELAENPVPICEHDKILFRCVQCWDAKSDRPLYSCEHEACIADCEQCWDTPNMRPRRNAT